MNPVPLMLIATLEGDTEAIPLGRSFLGRMARRTKNVGRDVGHGVATAGRAVGHVVATGGRTAGHGIATIGRAAGAIAMNAARLIIRKVAQPIIEKALGDEVEACEAFGADEPRTAADIRRILNEKRAAIVATVATAAGGAVAASGIAAPAAPVVGALTIPIVNQLIDETAAKFAGRVGLAKTAAPDAPSIDGAAVPSAEYAAAPAADSGTTTALQFAPVPAPSVQPAGVDMKKVAIIGGAAVVALLLLRRK